jgi:hypothetical protein
MKKFLNLCVIINAGVIIFISAYVLLIPAVCLIYDLQDPGLYGDNIPRCAFRWHKAFSPKYEKWARERVTSGAAVKLSTTDIAGTEWPVSESFQKMSMLEDLFLLMWTPAQLSTDIVWRRVLLVLERQERWGGLTMLLCLRHKRLLVPGRYRMERY